MRPGIFFLSLVTIFALHTGKAQGQQTSAPPPPNNNNQNQGQQNQVQPVMGAGINPSLLQGQWETECYEAVPGRWLIPSQMPIGPGNGQRAIYTFDGHRLIFQISEYRDPNCDPGDIVGTPFSKSGFWHYSRNVPQLPVTGELDFVFKYCSGIGCGFNDPNFSVYSSSTQIVMLNGSRLYIGHLDFNGNPIWTFRHPLYRPGDAPEDPR